MFTNLKRLLCASSLALALSTQVFGAVQPAIKVYKTRTCGCCAKWVDHLKANGFNPVVTDVSSVAEYRKQAGIPEAMGSCHTALVAGYAVEGHVPAADIKRLLKEKPKAKGLAVPGMPMGSPGMEQGSYRDAYAVYLVLPDGRTSIFQKYSGN